MDESTLLTVIKKSNNITGDYQDDAIRNHIAEVKEYMLGAGVSKLVINSSTTAGAINRGVIDLLYDKKLSDYFKERVIQLKYKGDDDV